METLRQDGTLTVTGLRELNVANARMFRSAVAAVLSPDLQRIEIDLSQTRVVDGCGLGAILSLYQTANEHRREGAVTIRLLNPGSSVRQMIELTRMHQLFEIVFSHGAPDNAPSVPKLS